MKKNLICLCISVMALASCADSVEENKKNNTSSTTGTQEAQSEVSKLQEKLYEENLQQTVKETWRFTEADKQNLTPKQQEILEARLKFINNPELMAAEAKRRKNQRDARRQRLLVALDGNGLSYDLEKIHYVQQEQNFQSIAEERCLTVEDLIKSNPQLKLGDNRVQAPFSGLVLNLPDHACS